MKPLLNFLGQFDWTYEQELPVRLDRFLGNLSSLISRSLWVKAIKAQRIQVNDAWEQRKERLLRFGDRIRFDFYLLARDLLNEDLSTRIPYQLLYSDENLVVVNKPSGALMHRIGFLDFSLVSQVGQDLGQELFVVHRLDKATSGVCVFARSAVAAAAFQKVLQSGGIHKIYLALSAVFMKQYPHLVTSPIGQDDPRIHSKKQKVDFNCGSSARTRIRRIGYTGEGVLYMVRIFTGRQHQIRVHMQSLGAPILNDELYSQTDYSRFPPMYDYNEADLGLHAYRLRFTCPFSGKPRVFTAPPVRVPFLRLDEATNHPLREFALYHPPKTTFNWRCQEDVDESITV